MKRPEHLIMLMAGVLLSFAPAMGQSAFTTARALVDSRAGGNMDVRRRVQIVGVSDAVVTPASGKLPVAPGSQTTAAGSRDTFCLVDTGNGAVRLRVVSAGRLQGQGFSATAANGAAIQYSLQLESLTLGLNISFNAAESAFDLPPGAAAPSVAACGAGNIRKTLTLIPTAGTQAAGASSRYTGKVHVDTLTLIATAL